MLTLDDSTMTLKFAPPGALLQRMQGAKDSTDLGTNQATAARAPGAPAVDPLKRTLEPSEMETDQQLNGVIAPIAGAVMPQTRTQTADTPEQFSDRQRFLNQRSLDQANVDAQNGMHFAETTAPSGMAQQMGDMARSEQFGYQQPDMTGAFSDAQEHAGDFARSYAWGVLSPKGQGTVDHAIRRLAQGGAA